jgi:hypothetical protein
MRNLPKRSPLAANVVSNDIELVAPSAALHTPMASESPVGVFVRGRDGGASLTFDAVTLVIIIQHRGEPPSERYLLRDVSGVIQPGQMFALMGTRCGRPSALQDACTGCLEHIASLPTSPRVSLWVMGLRPRFLTLLPRTQRRGQDDAA